MSQAAPESEDGLIGRVIEGRYAILERLAAGGMGVVYKAEQRPLGRVVALKILEIQKTPNASASFGQRFFLEASAAAKLAHPNTIVVHDYGKTDDGLYFIAMEHLDGGTLNKRLRKLGPLSPAEAIHVGLQVVSSLRDAHAQGLVHRDLKPGNVMFAPRGGDPLFVKVLDFGLVKVLGEGGENLGLTQSGVMMGSPRYMAPEQVKAAPVDARTDIYAFGAVLYHMLTGAPPFAAGSAYEAMNAHVNTPPPPLRSSRPDCTAGPLLEAVVMRCLEKDPAARFQSMDEVMGGLRGCEAEAGASNSGSYLGSALSRGGSSSSQPELSSQPGVSSTEASQPGSQPDAPASTGTYQRTVRFSAPDLEPPPHHHGSPEHASHDPHGSAHHEPAPSRSGSALKVALAVGALLVVGVSVAAAVVVWPRIDGEPAPLEPVQAAPPETTPEPPVEEPAVEPASVEPTIAAPAAAPAPLLLRTDPSGARVRLDGVDLGDTPIPLHIPDGERWRIEVSLDRYETRSVTVMSGQEELLLHLEPVAPEPAADSPRPQRPAPPSTRPEAPVVRPLPPPTSGPTHPDVYAPDLDSPWAN